MQQGKGFQGLKNIFSNPRPEISDRKHKRPHPQIQKIKVEMHGGCGIKEFFKKYGKITEKKSR